MNDQEILDKLGRGEINREQAIQLLLESGVAPELARQMAAIESGESDGDVIGGGVETEWGAGDGTRWRRAEFIGKEFCQAG